MNVKKSFFLFLFLPFYATVFFAQKSDSLSTIYGFRFDYGHHFPLADLSERFVSFSSAGGYFTIFHKSGYVFSLGGSFNFRDTIKQSGLLEAIEKNSFLLDGSGQIVNVFLWKRGFSLSASLGKAFKLKPKNMYLTSHVGFGFLQHKILLYSKEFYLPQVQDNYAKGYDRLSNGVMLSQDVLLHYHPRGRMYNIFFGATAFQSLTKNRRSYNFDLMGPEHTLRKDFSVGLKLGMTILFNRKIPQNYYFY